MGVRCASAASRFMPDAGLDTSTPFRFGAIILAAGASSRMGAVKQLVEIKGVPLVARAVDAALAAKAHPVVVVLGANAVKIRESLAGRPVLEALNLDWSTGLSSSVRVGLDAALAAEPTLDAVLLAPIDQPALSSGIIGKLADLHRATGRIASARYNGRNGAPAVFGRAHFDGLRALSGDQGARGLLNHDPEGIASVELPMLGIDLDTPEDVRNWDGRDA
jgi:molybdenum cofactor cytidylyltransferase